MPGFSICGGGSGPSANTEIRRKYRWAMTSLGSFTAQEMLFLVGAQRPNWKCEEPERHYQQEVTRYAGKSSWEPITLKWYDAEQSPDICLGIYKWMKTVVDIATANVQPPDSYKKSATLTMVTGTGNVSETWNLCNCWPKEVNFGDLDYTSTDLETIEVAMRYDRAQRQ